MLASAFPACQAAFGTYVANYYHITSFYFSGTNTIDQLKFAVEYSGRALKTVAFFSTDLGNASAFGQVTVQYLQVAGWLNGICYRVNNSLFLEVQ
jgi:hypothetical protein